MTNKLPPPLQKNESGKRIVFSAITQEQKEFMLKNCNGNQDDKYTAKILGVPVSTYTRIRLKLFGSINKKIKKKVIKKPPSPPEHKNWKADQDQVVMRLYKKEITPKSACKILSLPYDQIRRRSVYLRDFDKKAMIKDLAASVDFKGVTPEQSRNIDQWVRQNITWLQLLRKTKLHPSKLIVCIQKKHLMGWAAFEAHKQAYMEVKRNENAKIRFK